MKISRIDDARRILVATSASISRGQLENIQYMPISVPVRLHGCISKACKNDEEDHS